MLIAGPALFDNAGNMDSQRLGGGLLAAVAIAVPVIVTQMDLKIPIAVGIAGLAVCVVIGGLGAALALHKPDQPEPIAIDETRRDVGLADAICYATSGRWGKEPMSLDGSSWESVEQRLTEARQRAADGDIVIWGRPTPHGIYVPIPSTYWVEYQVEWFDFMRGTPRTEKVAPGGFGQIYWELMVSRSDFERYP